MKIAYIHYHLKTGGVTTVLRQQIEAVKNSCEALVITGSPPESPFPADFVYIPGLGYYDGLSKNEFKPEDIAESIAAAIFSKWKDGCDILHVHNPTLAKNINFLKILKELQKRKIRLFLQIHDFAEDGRPAAYFREKYLSDCHYGVINSRDYNILIEAGLKKEGLHKIFNTINPFDIKEKDADPKEYVLYPIRAIRRKNIGEAILLSRFFRNNADLVITQPPNSPADIISYKGWKKYVKDKNLNVEFEAGLKKDFKELVYSAGFLITTSITEGFGFSFLEPWTANKILCGRKLADICYDFEQRGIKLDHLYTKLLVPIKWIGKENLYEKLKSSILKAGSLFNYSLSRDNIDRFYAAVTKNNNIDFGLLDEAFQKQVLSRILSGKKERDRLIMLNPYISHLGDLPNKDKLIQENRKAVLDNYNKKIYKETLLKIYSRVIKKPVCQSIDKNILLSEFLNPNNFSLLKWSDYVE